VKSSPGRRLPCLSWRSVGVARGSGRTHQLVGQDAAGLAGCSGPVRQSDQRAESSGGMSREDTRPANLPISLMVRLTCTSASGR